MRLKEWGLMRHKGRKRTTDRTETRERSGSSREESAQCDQDSSATAEAMSIDTICSDPCKDNRGWQVVDNADAVAEPTFMGLLSRVREYA